MSKLLAVYLPSLRGGGAERVILTLVNEFSLKGYRVDLILAQKEGPYLAEVGEAVRLINLDSGRIASSLPKLVRYLRLVQPDALLTALSHTNIIAILARGIARRRCKLVVSEHSNFSFSSASIGKRREKMVRSLVRLTYPFADHVVAVSKGAADDLAINAGINRNKIRTIYNPIVSNKIFEKSKEKPVHPWFAENAPPVILSVGRLAPVKDYSTLLGAFSILRKEMVVRLIILGEGDLRPELEREIELLSLSDDVSMPGFVMNPYSYMRESSLFVLASRWEGFGNVIVEAMACGAQVVATNCPSGPAEILENGRWGTLVPVGDIKALADAMRVRLISQDKLVGQERAMDFSVDKAVDDYLDLLAN